MNDYCNTGGTNDMNLPVAYCKIDAEGEFIMANKRWLKLFETEVPTLPELQPHGQLTKEFVRDHMDEALRNGESSFELYADKPNQDFICVAITLQSEADGTFLACANDVTHYKSILGGAIKREQEEKKALDLARRFLDSAPIFIETWDNEMNLTGANQVAVKMFGLRDTDHYMEVYEKLHPEFQPCGMKTKEKIPLIIEEVMKNGYAEGEWMHIDLEGNPVPVQSCYVRFDVGNDEHYIVGYSQDLRPLRAAMAELENAIKTTQDLINSAPLFIEIWDENLTVIECNDVMAKMFKIPVKDAHTRIFSDLSPEFQPCGTPSEEYVRKYVSLAFKEGYAHVEYMHKDLDGKPFPVDVTYVRMRRDNKNVVIGYNVDLRLIKAANEMTQEFLDAAPFFVQVWNNNNDLIDCSQVAVKTFGISSKDEYINEFYKLCPDYQPCGRSSDEMIREIVSTAFKDGYARHEWMHLDKDGNLWPFDMTFVRMRRLDDDIVVVYATDLRPIKKAMDEVRRASELSQMYLDAAPFFVEIWDSGINLRSCNEATVKVFGLSGIHEYVKIFDELSPKFQPCGTPSDTKIKEIVGKAMKEGYSRCEWTHIGADGQPFPVDVVYVRLNNGEEDIIVGYNQDLRPLKAAMDKLLTAEEANRAKSSFLSTISHEIRTPLNAILGITEIRLMDKDIDQKIRDDLMKIYTSSDVLLKIINDILDLSKIEAGKLSILERDYEIASLIGDTIQLNIMRLDSKPVEFLLFVDEDMPDHVIGDDLRMKQILSNLLSNAFKYTEKGKVEVDIRTHDLPDCDERFLLEMKVTDTGVGLSEQQIENLFEEFSRFHESESSPEGTGLGMSITKKLVSLMGGKLSVESEVGKGSIFTASIPQGKVNDAKPLGKEMVENLQLFRFVGTQMDNTDIVREPMPYGKILVVDDVEINIYVVMGLLMPYELHVDDASNGIEAIEKVKSGNDYDIIFMDHMMPEMDGVEATRIIRAMGYTKPIVALTANAVSGQAEMFLKSGFDDFISKPIDVRSMDLILNKLVRNKHLDKLQPKQ